MSFVSLFILFSVDESNGSIYPHFYLGFCSVTAAAFCENVV